jgi:hypothetical protein
LNQEVVDIQPMIMQYATEATILQDIVLNTQPILQQALSYVNYNLF